MSKQMCENLTIAEEITSKILCNTATEFEKRQLHCFIRRLKFDQERILDRNNKDEFFVAVQAG